MAEATVVLMRGGAELGRWPLTQPSRPDLTTVDRLARWQLAARRLGCSIQVEAAGADLTALLELVGFDLRIQVVGEPEGPEQRGVEEAVDPRDPIA